MSGVGTASMGNQVGPHATIGEVHQVKPRCARGKGEVGDADKIPVADAVVMLLQSLSLIHIWSATLGISGLHWARRKSDAVYALGFSAVCTYDPPATH